MPERITRENLERRVDNLNRRMESRGSTVRYFVQGRNGSTALDRVNARTGSTMDLVRVGTKSEIGEFLHAMMVALDDAARTA